MLPVILSFMAILTGRFSNADAMGNPPRIKGSLFFKCDSTVVSKIEALYGGASNNDLLEEILSFNKLVIKSTTSKFLLKDVKCTSITISKEDSSPLIKVTAHEILKEKGKSRDLALELTAIGDTFVDKEDYVTVYSVYTKNNIFACYPCLTSDDGKLTCLTSDDAADGPPSGFVSVSENNYTSADFIFAVGTMESVGVKCVEAYPDVCP